MWEILVDVLTLILEEEPEVITRLLPLLRGLNMNGSKRGESRGMMCHRLREAAAAGGRWEELILLGEAVSKVNAEETVDGYADLLSQQFSSSRSYYKALKYCM